MNFRGFLLNAVLSSGFYVAQLSHAGVDGYGNETPSISNTGSNYQDRNNQRNPYIQYDTQTIKNPSDNSQPSASISRSFVGFSVTDFSSTLDSEPLLTAIAYNLEGNNLQSTPGNRSSLSVIGNKGVILLYKNNADYISLTASEGGRLLIDGNSATGTNISNSNAYILLKNNNADNSKISNENQGVMLIDGNSVNGSTLINDNAQMNIYHNIATGMNLSNVNGASLTSLGNDISGSEVNNSSSSTITVGDCDIIVCQEITGTTAQNIVLKNDGNLLFTGNVDIRSSTINNSGLISGALDDINFTGSYVQNSGYVDFSGKINMSDSIFYNQGQFTLSNANLMMSGTAIKNAGTFALNNVDIFNGTLENSGKVVVEGNNVISMNIENSAQFQINQNAGLNLNGTQFTNKKNGYLELHSGVDFSGDINNSGVIAVVNDSNKKAFMALNGTLYNNGTLSLASTGNIVGNTMTINGDYIGYSGSQIVMNSMLNGDNSASDGLHITGNSQGESTVYINNLGGRGAQTVEGINIITVDGNSDARFIQGSRIVAGSYDYTLEKSYISSGNWYLTSNNNIPVTSAELTTQTESTPQVKPLNNVNRERPEASSYIANIAAANAIFNSGFEERRHEKNYRDPLNGENKTSSLWMRNEGNYNRWNSSSGQLKTKSKGYVLQIGNTLREWSFSNLDSIGLGVMIGYANNRSKTNSSLTGYTSRGSTEGYSAGLYSTWYEDAQTRAGYYVDTWLQYNWFHNSVKGDTLSIEYYDSKGVTASIETGYAVKLNDFAFGSEALHSWYLEPHAQVLWMGVIADNHTESNGTKVASESNGNIQTRLGIKTYMNSLASMDSQRDILFQPYVEGNWFHNTDTLAVKMDKSSVSQAGSRNIWEVNVGMDSMLKSNLSVSGGIGTQIGGVNYRNSTLKLGVKYDF